MFITKLDDFLFVNKWEINITFNPEFTGDAAFFDLYMDGVLLPEFDPKPEYYNVTLPHGSITVPEITVTRFDYDATLHSSEAASLQDMTKIVVTSEDRKNTTTYSVNFTIGTNELMGVIAPGEIIPENARLTVPPIRLLMHCGLSIREMQTFLSTIYSYRKY